MKREKGKGRSENMKRDLCERTFKFALRITRLCQKLSEKPGVGRAIGRQLFDSGTSIGANVEEGQDGQSKADFVSKYSIALKEARETRYWLRLLVGSEICRENEISGVIKECGELIAILTTIVKKAKGISEKG